MTGYSAGFQEVMSKRMQRIHHKTDVFRAIASFEEQSNLKKGDTVHRLKKTLPRVQTYTRGTAMSIGVHAEADESLVVNTSKVAPFYVDDLDQLQFNFKYQMEFGEDMAIRLGNFIDGDVLGEVLNASLSAIDDLKLNPQTGTSGNGVLVSASNLQRVFTLAQRILTKGKIPMDKRYVVMSPEFFQALIDYLAGKNTPMADTIGLNGKVDGGRYIGFQIYISNANTFTATVAIATQPTDGDTVTINGVTFTFKTTLGSTAGNVLIGGSASAANTNLAALINTPQTTTANGVAIDGTTDLGTGFTALDSLTGITAVAAATSVAITSKGNGAIAVSSVLTATADGWTAATQIEHIMFGREGAVDVVIQAEPKIEVKDVPDKLGKNVIPWTLYGKKTFREGALQMLDFKRRTDQD
jgi:hypothetical protein